LSRSREHGAFGIHQFDTILQQQLAANMLPPGTLIIANVPRAPKPRSKSGSKSGAIYDGDSFASGRKLGSGLAT
jgi:hypothetical protein